MAKRAYEASGKSDDGAVPIFIVAVLASGVIAGVIEGYVSQWFSLVVLFPLVVGLAAGGVGAMLVKSKNIRAPLLVAAVGLLGGVLGQLAVMYVRYLLVRAEVSPEVAEQLTFLTYYELAAETGVTISRHGSGGPTLTGVGYHIFTAFNFLFAGGAGAATARSAAVEPFCESCKRWYDGDEVIFVCESNKAATKQTIALLESGEFSRAVKDASQVPDKQALLFHISRCTQCQSSDPLFTLKTLVRAGKKEQLAVSWKSLITHEQLAEMKKAATPA